MVIDKKVLDIKNDRDRKVKNYEFCEKVVNGDARKRHDKSIYGINTTRGQIPFFCRRYRCNLCKWR